MKTYITFLLIILGFLILPSCSKSSDEPDEEEPKVDNPDDSNDPDDPILEDPSQTLVISFKGSTYQKSSQLDIKSDKSAIRLVIDSDPDWRLTAANDWIKLAAPEGKSGKMGLIVGFNKNTFTPRTGKIEITSGNNTHEITVNQAGAPKIFFSIDEVDFSMILVEGGTFLMGSSDIYGSEYSHPVTVSSFYLGETEVTNALWKKVMVALPYDALEEYEGGDEQDKPNHPVSAVAWAEINDHFFPKIKERLNFTFRLPTEAEWEYAASGGKNQDAYNYAGSNTLDDVAWSYYNSSEKQPVAQLQPNSLGLFDMSGNVSEWCRDWHKRPYESGEDLMDPTGPISGEKKIVRGGSFRDQPSLFGGPGNLGVQSRDAIIPTCYDGCWGNTGHPREPICFWCNEIGFRFVMPLK